jgi:hypothetical protein
MKPNKHFSKKEVQMANKYMKKYSIYLSIREMQIKTILRFHLNNDYQGQTQQGDWTMST